MSLNKKEMDEVTGWLFDVYEHREDGIVLWVIADSGERLRLRMEFPITFYVAGDFKLLRAAWRFLSGKAGLARTKRRDLFQGEQDVMSVTTHCTSHLFQELQAQFPELDYYNVDIPCSLRFIAQTGVYPLGRCRILLNGERILTIEPLESPWEIDHSTMPMRKMEIFPDVDPAFRDPSSLKVKTERGSYVLNLHPIRPFLISLHADFKRLNPDLILTDYGDGWLFPKLMEWRKEAGLHLDINRDQEREIETRKANSYFTYGQMLYRGAQSLLFGRWHIDRKNAMLFSEYGLEGVLEQARVTGLGVQEMARKSPGAGITTIQMLTALKTGVMIPLHKQQAESEKTLAGLIRADKGGLIYQPIIGVHKDVAQIDFASMYPSIMVYHNISPETLGIRDIEPGLIPQALKPLLEKRLQLKQLIQDLDERDCKVKVMKQRAAALKWLLVVCFGYLGYKNARFGKIESHEAVTAISRELMLQAKEVAEDLGFTVLHMYVDSLFVQKDGLKEKQDFELLLKAITEKTKLPIAVEGVYRWICFLPSKRDIRISVPNRYFGVFIDGEVKYRGIEARRRDTPYWVKRVQLEVLNCLAKAKALSEIPEYLIAAETIVKQAKDDLRNGHVSLGELVITQSLSREVGSYKTPSPAARAAKQLQSAGRQVAPGQFMRFIFIRGDERVRVWEVGIDPRMVDIKRYCILLDRAIASLTCIFEQEKKVRDFPIFM